MLDSFKNIKLCFRTYLNFCVFLLYQNLLMKSIYLTEIEQNSVMLTQLQNTPITLYLKI